MLIPASPEFVELCEAQVTLLAQAMGASWSAVYLTEKWIEPGQPHLRPIAAYPEQTAEPLPRSLTPANFSETSFADEPPTTDLTPVLMPWEESAVWGRRQVILPLLHDEMVLGLLVSRRVDRVWQEFELEQIHHITHTLGLACFLDQQSQQLHHEVQDSRHREVQRQEQLALLLHQIRSPMTAIRTLSKLLLKRFAPEDSNYPVGESLVKASDRLQWLLEQLEHLLNQSPAPTPALESSTTPLLPGESDRAQPLSLLPSASLVPTELELEPILRPLLVSAAEIAHQQDIRLSYHFREDVLPILGDAIALQEVFSNLLDNAIKYTPAGGKILVDVGLEAGNSLGVAIQDSGVGIPEADQARIFERNYRGVQAEGEIPGSGLGLAVVQDLVMQMAGEITVISPNPEQVSGTTFVVWLPLA